MNLLCLFFQVSCLHCLRYLCYGNSIFSQPRFSSYQSLNAVPLNVTANQHHRQLGLKFCRQTWLSWYLNNRFSTLFRHYRCLILAVSNFDLINQSLIFLLLIVSNLKLSTAFIIIFLIFKLIDNNLKICSRKKSPPKMTDQ